ncbi:MAG TPA: hypothetical protein PK597_02695 [Oscillospiraceae bacterium]|nr:hypothetical protein [Oscillospiraceae bacterium]
MKSVKNMLLGLAFIAFGTFLCFVGNDTVLFAAGFLLAPIGFILCAVGFFQSSEK